MGHCWVKLAKFRVKSMPLWYIFMNKVYPTLFTIQVDWWSNLMLIIDPSYFMFKVDKSWLMIQVDQQFWKWLELMLTNKAEIFFIRLILSSCLMAIKGAHTKNVIFSAKTTQSCWKWLFPRQKKESAAQIAAEVL